MSDHERKQPRTEREQLLTLLNQWDPAGLLQTGAQRNEYAGMAERLFDLLTREPSEEDVSAFVEREVREHFNTSAPDPDRFAAKVLTWSRLRSQEP